MKTPFDTKDLEKEIELIKEKLLETTNLSDTSLLSKISHIESRIMERQRLKIEVEKVIDEVMNKQSGWNAYTFDSIREKLKSKLGLK